MKHCSDPEMPFARLQTPPGPENPARESGKNKGQALLLHGKEAQKYRCQQPDPAEPPLYVD